MRTIDSDARLSAPGRFVTLSDGVTHYQLASAENDAVAWPPAVLIHGFSVPSFIWDPTFEGLAAVGVPVLRYDLLGRGYSDRPRMRYDIDLFDRQLVDLVAALDLPTPVDVIGLSMGGAIAVGFTDRHPALVRRLALIDPAGFPMPGSLATSVLRLPVLGELLLATAGKRVFVSGLRRDFQMPALLPDLTRKYRVQMQYAGFLRSLLSTLRYGPIQTMAPAYARVGRQPRPIALIWGTEDRTVPFKMSERVRAALPNAQFHPIEGCGHVPHLERPELVNRILIDFLAAD
ncbi:MAG: alpha/beta fold hydrolase [Anaerolineae bacterium]|nr:alpha/beta fold hydrolase [Anaerolineae bacterium]